jgi:membrane-associated phospholipid phosphatase
MLTLLMLFGLTVVAFFFRSRLPLWQSLIFRYLLWIGMLWLIQLSYDRNPGRKWARFVYTFSPILFIVLIYQSLGDLIQYLHPDIDPVLIQIDQSLFGVQPTIYMQRWITPWLTDLLSLAYLSYYFLPVILVLVLYLKGHPGLYPSLLVLALGYYLSFVGYILFPAVGPRYAIADLYTIPLDGSFITDFVRDGLNAIEHNKRDCMPSGHTQIALTVVYLSHRYRKVLFYMFTPVVCALIFSTIYLRYHYVIDLVAGATLALVTVLLGPGCYAWWEEGSQ